MNPSFNSPLPEPVSAPLVAVVAPVASRGADAPERGALAWLAPLLVLALIQFGAPFVSLPRSLAVVIGAAIVLTLLYAGAVVAFSLALARRQMALPILVSGFVLGGVAFRAIQFLPPFRFAYTLQTFVLLGLGTFAGLLVARLIRHANMIGPIGVMVAVIDIWGVLFGGIVVQLLTNKATRHIAAKAMGDGPRLGAQTTGVHIPLPDIGIGDFLFLALFLGVLVRFGMNWRTSAKWMWALVSLALLAIALPTGVPVLPGLVPIALGALAPNLRYFHYTREERFALLYAGVFVLILTIGLYFGISSLLPKQ